MLFKFPASPSPSGVVALLCLCLTGQSNAQQEAVPELNWRPLSELSPEELAKVPSACCGAYVAPEIPPLETAGDNPNAWNIDADTFTMVDQVYTYQGNVTLQQGRQLIEAERITANEETRTAVVEGPITINEPGALFRGQRAEINRETGAALIEEGQFVLYASRLRGGAERLVRDENEAMTLTDGQFTQCEPGNESWLMKGSEIHIDPNTQQGTIRDMRLEVGGVPVLYLPYWTFPAGDARQSGFLFPSITSKDLAIPYYFNLAPNYDLTVAPRYVSERGAMVEVETRHLNRYFDTVLAGAWLPSGEDGISDNEREAINAETDPLEADALRFKATEFDGEDRWLVSLQQNGGSMSEGPRQAAQLYGSEIPRWFSKIDYTRVSDYAYFRHINTTNLDINRQTHLRQYGDLGYQFPDWRINLHAEAYQSIIVDGVEPYRQLPKLEADGIYRFGAGSDWQLTLNNEVTQFTHRDEFWNDNPADPRITGQRVRFDYGVAWDKQWIWGFFNPGVALKSVNYQLDEDTLAPGADDQPGVSVPQATLDGGLFFERDGSWFGADYLQTFEPRLFYFYSDFEDQGDFFNLSPTGRPINFDTNELTFSYSQLFRDTRFAGGDRIEDANQLSVGLTTRFLGRESGQQRLSLSLGQIYYLEDRRVNLNAISPPNTALQSKSEIAGQITAQLTDSLQLTGDGLFDPERHQWNQRGINLRYYDQQQRIVNLGYRYQRENELEQAELSFVLPIVGNWNVIGHTYHDFVSEEALDSIIGVEYTSCCYRVRVVGRRWFDNDLIELVDEQNLEHERGIFIEFQLRGLGSVLDTINGVLSESIVNYERREESIR